MDSYEGADAIERAWRDGLKPDPLLTVSEWADRHRVLSQRASSEPGRWRTQRTPYLKEIMDCLSPSSPVQRVVFMKGSQTGGTEAGNCWIGYVVHQAPGPMMAVSPTVELAKRNSKQRIDPLIEESEVLRERVKERRSRDSGNTVLSKEFPGGVLILTGANSAVGLRSMPARYLFLDEVDGYPGDVEGEGDPILLAERRSATFQRRKILLVSTPKTKGLSRIEREYEVSDQRRYFVPCPYCHEHQTLEFENLRWPEGRPREAEYACEHCGSLIGERHKTWMLEHGAWQPTGESDGRTAGFHLSSLYSPVGWFSWADAAEMYEQAQKTPDLMKGFVNTVLGLPFEEEAEAPEWSRLYERRQSYRVGVVPEPGLFLTAGADVQKDRLEVEVVAWGRSKESWSVDYRVIEGDTARPEVWAKLDAVLARDWPHASGHTLPIRVMCVDAGYATQDVYAWVRQHPQASWGPAGAAARQPRAALAVKGRDRDTALLLSVSKADAGGKRRGLRVWSVGTPVAKGELYCWLKLEWPTEEALADGASYGSSAHLLMKRETTYGQAATGDYIRMPFNRCDLGSEQGLIDDPVLGQGRDPLAPLQDVINDEGDIVLPVDPRYLGLWLTGLFGARGRGPGRCPGELRLPWRQERRCRAHAHRHPDQRPRRHGVCMIPPAGDAPGSSTLFAPIYPETCG